jgi:SnoaL-like domain
MTQPGRICCPDRGEDLACQERVRGKAAYLRFNLEGFPWDWHLNVERIVGEGRHAASWVEFCDAGGRYPGVCFFDLDEDGRIARITDIWPAPPN